jgi:intron-binding protein aquarius
MVMQQGRGVLAGIQQGTPVVGHKRSLDVLESTGKISQEGQGKAIAVLKKLSGSLKLWDPSAPKNAPFKPEIVTRLYTQLSRPKGQRVVQLLELSQYLECYLWAHFDDKASSDEHVMSVIILVNEKFREGVPAWDTFVGASAPENTPADTQKWRGFVHRVLSLVPGEPSISGRPMAPHEATQYLRFLIHLFQSLEAAHVRAVALPLTSIPLWHALSARRREMELLKDPRLAKKWRAMIRKDGKDAAAAKAEVSFFEGHFSWLLK